MKFVAFYQEFDYINKKINKKSTTTKQTKIKKKHQLPEWNIKLLNWQELSVILWISYFSEFT